jgi:hypothetical protein
MKMEAEKFQKAAGNAQRAWEKKEKEIKQSEKAMTDLKE